MSKNVFETKLHEVALSYIKSRAMLLQSAFSALVVLTVYLANLTFGFNLPTSFYLAVGALHLSISTTINIFYSWQTTMRVNALYKEMKTWSDIYKEARLRAETESDDDKPSGWSSGNA